MSMANTHFGTMADKSPPPCRWPLVRLLLEPLFWLSFN
jgi:hypothetical protein